MEEDVLELIFNVKRVFKTNAIVFVVKKGSQLKMMFFQIRRSFFDKAIAKMRAMIEGKKLKIFTGFAFRN